MREKDKSNKNTSKRNELEASHYKLHQETLEDKEIARKLKEEEQIENRKQLKEGDTDNNKPKEIKSMRKN